MSVAPFRPPLASALEEARATICSFWPHHWTVVEAVLAAYATLLLKDVTQGLALVMVARSGAGKGTILSFFQGAARSMWRDSFTRSSLLSGSGDVSKAAVEKDALFRLVKDKVLLVGDLAPILRSGDKDKLSDFYTHFSVWMDGRGLMRQVGTHGEIGEKGDFQFVLVGAMTPPTRAMWRGMAELGPRLLFLPLDRGLGNEVPAHQYAPAVELCTKAVRTFLTRLFALGPLRSAEWPTRSPAVEERLRRLGELIALSQTMQAADRVEEPVAPTSAHLRQRMTVLLTGRALIHGRTAVDDSDLALGELIVCRTGPSRRGLCLLALDRGARTVGDVAAAAELSYHDAWSALDDLRRSLVVESTAAPFSAAPSAGRPAEEWSISRKLL